MLRGRQGDGVYDGHLVPVLVCTQRRGKRVVQGGRGQQLVLQRGVTWMGRQRATCSRSDFCRTRSRASPHSRTHAHTATAMTTERHAHSGREAFQAQTPLLRSCGCCPEHLGRRNKALVWVGAARERGKEAGAFAGWQRERNSFPAQSARSRSLDPKDLRSNLPPMEEKPTSPRLGRKKCCSFFAQTVPLTQSLKYL